MWAHLLLSLLFLHLARCNSGTNYFPVRRYHPTSSFPSNDQHDSAASAQDLHYAYEGGESHTGGVDFSHSHSSDYTHPVGGHVGEIDHIRGHAGEVDLTHGHSNEVDLTQGHSVHIDLSQGHTGEVDLTSSQSDLTSASSDVDLTQDHSYHYPPPDHILEFDHGYHYDPPHGYGYLPPSPHAIHSLPAITTPPPPPAQSAKQSPSYTYYYLGRHLWYIPLYFSIYFVLYVGALVLKSVARHKILFPDNLKVAAQARALNQLEEGTRKYYM